MTLKPQDLLVLLKLVAIGERPWTYNALAIELGMSPAEVHSAVRRSLNAGLAVRFGKNIRPAMRNLQEFLLHGVQYVFVPERGGLTRGMLTAHAAFPMVSEFVGDAEPPPVWPDPEGEARGLALSPLYKSVPGAARKDQRLYELLVLVDGVRSGRARERDFAGKELIRRLEAYGQGPESEC